MHRAWHGQGIARHLQSNAIAKQHMIRHSKAWQSKASNAKHMACKAICYSTQKQTIADHDNTNCKGSTVPGNYMASTSAKMKQHLTTITTSASHQHQEHCNHISLRNLRDINIWTSACLHFKWQVTLYKRLSLPTLKFMYIYFIYNTNIISPSKSYLNKSHNT